MILLIDNYDSFSYNLVQYIGEIYGDVLVKRNDEITVEEIDVLCPEAIVLSPGPCTPNEAGICLDIVRTFSGAIPILGVCLGHQTIVQAFGGVISKVEKLYHGKTSQIIHDSQSVYNQLPNPTTVGRYHSLIADAARLPESLIVTSWTADGVIMGIRHKEFAVEGVQFHPESILTEYGKKMLQNFFDEYHIEQRSTVIS